LQLQEWDGLFPKPFRGDGISSDSVRDSTNTPHEALHSTRRRVLSPHGCKIEDVSATSLHPIPRPDDSLADDRTSHSTQHCLTGLILNRISGSPDGANSAL
jgi:hypothetical protein